MEAYTSNIAILHQGFLSEINTNTLTSSIWQKSIILGNVNTYTVLTSHFEAQLFKIHKHTFGIINLQWCLKVYEAS